MNPDLSILVPDVGAPSLGAAVRLADHLSAHHHVEVVGPDFGGGVCSMYRDAFPYRVVKAPHLYRLPDYWWEREKLAQAATGRVIIAVKAFMDTLPVALREKRRRGARVVAYLDEWDGAVLEGRSRWRRTTAFLRHAHWVMDEVYYPRVEARLREADLVLSSTSFLQSRFGGEVVPMGVDTERFCPQSPAQVEALRAKLGLVGKRLVVFGGVVRPHKGVEDLLDALALVGDSDVNLLVAGPVTGHLARLQKDARYRPYLKVAGAPQERDPGGVNQRVHRDMPLYLDLADLMVLPLRDDALARSQMPIKLFEALAMAKPVVATEVSDLPRVLETCGRCCAPGDVAALAALIRDVLASPAEAQRMGRNARALCLDKFSSPVIEGRLAKLMAPLLA